jgi:NADH:ubiquinone oxidoreductase subunit
MELKIIVPTNIWEFEPIQKQWFGAFEDMNNPDGIDIQVIHEQGEAPSGRNVRQKYTDLYAGEDVYLHLLDNDNLIPFGVLSWLHELIETNPPKIFMFGQIWDSQGIKRLNAKPENCIPCKCDLAQVFVHGSFLKDITWTNDYHNDGLFIETLYKRYPNDFVFINDVNVWYNALRPNSTLYNGQIITIA